MRAHDIFIHFPRLYAFLCSWRRNPNFEKVLYLRTIKKNHVVFDIGANVGVHSKIFTKLTGKDGFVHCFEPVPETFQMLEDSLVKSENVKLNNLAAGDSETMMEIAYDPDDSEKATLLGQSTPTSSMRMVKVLPLDKYAREVKLQRLDFLKCDVEGFELNVLMGLKDTLAIHRPKISVEITLPQEQTLELVNLLESLGYDSFRKIEKGFPKYAPHEDILQEGDYFYLHAVSSLVT
ncbi:FkbM family methyltransferase [Opitutales bacterium]|jgi:FkbM family methyltransferase|nr:FkbM family methyltransferase [Opitutales bacterium]